MYRIEGEGLDPMLLMRSPHKRCPGRLVIKGDHPAVLGCAWGYTVKPTPPGPVDHKLPYMTTPLSFNFAGKPAKTVRRIAFQSKLDGSARITLDTRTCEINDFGDAANPIGPEPETFELFEKRQGFLSRFLRREKAIIDISKHPFTNFDMIRFRFPAEAALYPPILYLYPKDGGELGGVFEPSDSPG